MIFFSLIGIRKSKANHGFIQFITFADVSCISLQHHLILHAPAPVPRHIMNNTEA